MEVLVLPILGLTVICFLAYIWTVWLSDKKGRSIQLRGRPRRRDEKRPPPRPR